MPASKAQQAATAQRRQKMMALKLAGADWPTIADACQYSSRAAACKDFSRALDQSRAEVSRNAEVLRHELLLKLERLQRAVWPTAMAGDPQAVLAALKVVMAQVDLQGLKKLPPPEDGQTYDRRESIRSQGAALAQVVGKFVSKLAMDTSDPRVLQALQEAVQEVTGIAMPPQPAARKVIEIEGEVVLP